MKKKNKPKNTYSEGSWNGVRLWGVSYLSDTKFITQVCEIANGHCNKKNRKKPERCYFSTQSISSGEAGNRKLDKVKQYED